MFLTGHAAVGLLAAAWTTNPALALGAGFLSHYVADAVPHGDEDLGKWAAAGHEVRRLALLMLLDLAVLAFAYAWLYRLTGWHWWHVFAIAGACAPDFMWGFEKAIGRKVFGPMNRWHKNNHNRWHVRIPAWWGIPVQLIITAGLWWWLLAA